MMGGYTYIMGSASGTLYIGVTSDLDTRVLQHKNGAYEGFSKIYGCTRLLYYEGFAYIEEAIAREKQLKGWRREKKIALIRKANPEFRDLAEKLGWKLITQHERMKP